MTQITCDDTAATVSGGCRHIRTARIGEGVEADRARRGTGRAKAAAQMLTTAALLFASHSAVAQTPQESLPGIVALNLQPLNGVQPDQALLFTEAVVRAMSRMSEVPVTSEADLRAVLGGQRFELLMGCKSNTTCVSNILLDLKTEYLLYGSVSELKTPGYLKLSLTLLRVGTPLIGRSYADADAEDFEPAVEKAVRRLFDPVVGPVLPQEKAFPWGPSILMGSGVVSAGTGIAVGIAAVQDNNDSGKNIADGLLIGGSVVAVGGLVWLLASVL